MRKKKELNLQIGNQIRKARERSGLTQEQFAEAIDNSPQFISDLERGLSGISLETLKKICETLQVSSDTILFTETIQADMAVEKLTNKFLNMTPEQLRIMEAITNAFLQASNK